MENEATGDATSSAAGACVGADGHAIGMPQLCVEWYANQIFWLIVAVGAIYLILTRVALPRLSAVLAERNGAITNDIAAAEELKLKAAEAERAYEKALADAKAESQRIAAEARAEIQAELDAAVQKADAEIAARAEKSAERIAAIQESATESVDQVARETAREIVAAFDRPVDADAVAAAVDAQTRGGA